MEALKFEFSPEEVNKILAGLGELKASHSIDLIIKIKSEAEKQIKVSEESSKNAEDLAK